MPGNELKYTDSTFFCIALHRYGIPMTNENPSLDLMAASHMTKCNGLCWGRRTGLRPTDILLY